MPQVIEERELIRAQARYVRSSARKARLVLEHIRGKSAVEAQSILAFQTRAVARDAGKVLKSAIANAENNSGHDADELVVVYAYADEGPTLKRWRARARGRVNRIRKRTCHITITLSPALPGEIKPRPERRPRPADEVPAETEKPKRRRKAAAPTAEAATAETVEESAAEETATEPEVVEEAAAEEQAEAKPTRRRKPAAKAEPEAEAAAEPDASEAEPEPEATVEPDPEPEPEPATEEPSDTEPDDDSKEADS
ncbi:MAG: 50S ribosomal protein L22 [Gaiellales bacterium]